MKFIDKTKRAFGRQHVGIQALLIVGSGVAVARNVAQIDKVSPAVGLAIDTISFPFEFAISILGSAAGLFVPGVAKVTNRAYPDVDGDGKHEGAIGEMV